MAEGARLESVYTLTRISGSNPDLTAIAYLTPFLPTRTLQQVLYIAQVVPTESFPVISFYYGLRASFNRLTYASSLSYLSDGALAILVCIK